MQMTKSIVEGRGVNFTMSIAATGRSAGVFLPLMSGTPYADLINRLDTALAMFGAMVAQNVGEYQATALPTKNRAAVVNSLVPSTFKDLQRVGLSETTATAKAWTVASTIDATTISTQAIRARACALMDGTDLAGQARLLQGFNEQQLAGVLEVGMLDALPPEIATTARDRYIALRHVRLTGLQADYALSPSENAPLASGPDVEAAQAASTASLNELKQRSKNVDTVTTVLNDVITIVQLSCELHRPQAYLLLTTGNIDG